MIQTASNPSSSAHWWWAFDFSKGTGINNFDCLPFRLSALVLANGLVADFGSVLHKQGFKRQAFWEQKVPDVVASDGKLIQILWLSSLDNKFDSFEMSVHRNVDSSNSSFDNCAIFKLNLDGLAIKLH
jgi:hypothetical protein